MNTHKGLRPEPAQVREAVRLLTEAGYPLVETEPTWATKLGVRPDVVAWGPDEDGVLTPMVLVEAKADLSVVELQLALAILSKTAAPLGTRTNLLRVRDQWFLARDGFMSADPVAQVPAAMPGPAVVTEPEVAARLFGAIAWSQDNRERGWRRPEWNRTLEQLLESDANASNAATGMVVLREGILVPYDVLIRGWVDYTLTSGSREAGEHLTPRSLAQTMADLAGPYRPGGLVLDPFAGYGTSLAYAALAGRTDGADVSVYGRELNPPVARTAQLLLRGMEISGQLVEGDSFQEPSPLADVVVSAPPWGMKLQAPVRTPVGPTNNGDIAAVALCVDALKPGGRAVLHTSRSWTFSSQPAARELRRWLLERFHVAALVSIPPVSRLTGVSGILLVVDLPPTSPGAEGDTIVANLRDDWAEQLAPSSHLGREIRQRPGWGTS